MKMLNNFHFLFIFLVGAGVWSVGGNITVGWKEDVRLPCESVGDPEPQLSWTHELSPLATAGSNR